MQVFLLLILQKKYKMVKVVFRCQEYKPNSPLFLTMGCCDLSKKENGDDT